MPFDGSEIKEEAAILLRGKALIQSEGWCSKGEGEDGGPHCVVSAISRANDNSWSLILVAQDIFIEANGIETDGGIGTDIGAWNDAPERTLEEIYAAFDRAIAAAI